MKKIIALTLAALTITGCELTSPPAPAPAPKPIKTKHIYTGWDENLSKVICYTNGVTLKYDNTLDKLEIGIQDDITGLTNYNGSSLAELINVDQEKNGDTTVYNLVYVIGSKTFKYRMTYGLWKNNKIHNKIHNSPRMKEIGYKPVKGKLSENGETSKNKSFCWGINRTDRKTQALKQSKNH